MGFYDYVFGLGVTFAVLDAMGCGANDVANAFATAVNSKTLTMIQAMMIATVMEITGAMTLGSNNANTIRGSIIQVSQFNQNGGALMFGMLCVVISSSLFNFLSNRYGWATSSTHAIIGALIGVGVASGAGVQWGYVVTQTNGQVSGQNGLGAVVASFFISPVMAGTIGALVYLAVHFSVLSRKGPSSFLAALRMAPFWYGAVAAFEAWLIVWKTPRFEKSVSDETTIAVFFGVFGVVGLATLLFVNPFIYRSVWQGWEGVRYWHMPFMVLKDESLIKMFPGINKTNPYFDDRHLRGEEVPESESWQWTDKEMRQLAKARGLAIPGPASAGAGAAIKDKEVASAEADSAAPGAKEEGEAGASPVEDPEAGTADAMGVPVTPTAVAIFHGKVPAAAPAHTHTHDEHAALGPDGKPQSAWEIKKSKFKADMADPSLSKLAKAGKVASFLFLWGVDREIADYGLEDEEIAVLHDGARKHYGKTEKVFRFLQALTSSVASFAHGANDVGLSVGPISTMYYYWTTGGRVNVPRSSTVLDWQLAVGGVCLVLGLWFYGYNMMRVLGNRLTFHSPSRGFAMELGAAITVLVAARNGIPVSTTNCIVGATVGVGLVSEGVKGVNWKLFGFTMFTWLYTLPFTGLVSGLLYAFVMYAPNLSCPTTRLAAVGGQPFSMNGRNVTGSVTLWPAGC